MLVPVVPWVENFNFYNKLFLSYSIHNPVKHNYFVHDWIVYGITELHELRLHKGMSSLKNLHFFYVVCLFFNQNVL